MAGDLGSPFEGPRVGQDAPGLHPRHPGREEASHPLGLPRQEAGRADLRQLHLRAVPGPVRVPRRPAQAVRRPGRVPGRLRPRGAPDRRLAASAANDNAGIVFAPAARPRRSGAAVAQACCAALKITMPLAGRRRSTTGSATPTAACPTGCTSSTGRARSRTRAAAGRSASSPPEMEQSLAMLLLDEAGSPPTKAQERLPMLPNDQAWRRLPGRRSGSSRCRPGRGCSPARCRRRPP